MPETTVSPNYRVTAPVNSSPRIFVKRSALAEITGEFTADDLLGEIFGSFCIGK